MTRFGANPTKKARIVDELRQEILSGAIPRGMRLQQDEVAARFQVSITPVREALRQLEVDGLVISEPHRGVIVRPLDMDDIKAAYVMRRLIEPYAFARASRRLSRLDIARLAGCTDAMAAANDAGDTVGVCSANRDFHFLFYERCGIPSLATRLEELWSAFPWDLLMTDARVDSSVDEHRAILDAFEADDAEVIRQAAETHVARSYARISASLHGQAGPDPFDLATD